MSEPTKEDVIDEVSSIFSVSEIEHAPESLNFKIEDGDFKAKFVFLAQRLEVRNIVCRLQKKPSGLYILVSRFPKQKQRKWMSPSWTPRSEICGPLYVDIIILYLFCL